MKKALTFIGLITTLSGWGQIEISEIPDTTSPEFFRWGIASPDTVTSYHSPLTIETPILPSDTIWERSIAPAKGDRMNYFLCGDVWETYYHRNHRGFVLKVFVSPDGQQFVWIQNLSMDEDDLLGLMHYINTLPDFFAGEPTYSAPAGTNNWKVDSFNIYGPDYYDVPIDEISPPNIPLLMNKIRGYFN